MKLALIASYAEIPLFVRCLGQIGDISWIGAYIEDAGKDVSEAAVLPATVPQWPSPDLLIEQAEAVLVSASEEKRFDYISHAIRKGKAVWSAYPLAMTLPEYQKLAALADEARVINQVAHLDRRSPIFAVALPYIKDTRMVRVELSRRYKGDSLQAFLKGEFFPYLDRALSAVGSDVKKIKVKIFDFGEVRQARIKIFMEMNSGAEAEFWIDRVAASALSRMMLTGERCGVELDFIHATALLKTCEDGRTLHQTTLFVPPGKPLEDDVTGFLKNISQGISGNLTFAESARTAGIFQQIIHQAEINA